jgi:WD40 repeat protein
MAFNTDGDICYTGGSDGLICGWNVASGKKVSEMTGFKKSVTDISCGLDGEYVVASSVDGHRMHLYRVKTNLNLIQYRGH